jgi:hypothetical protein
MPRSNLSKAPTLSGDAALAWGLIARAKAEGVEIASVTVGGCSVELRQAAPAASDQPAARDPRRAIYETFGGEMLARMEGRSKPAAASEIQDEWVPTIGAKG